MDDNSTEPKIFGSNHRYSFVMKPQLTNFSIKFNTETLWKLGHFENKKTLIILVSYSIFNKKYFQEFKNIFLYFFKMESPKKFRKPSFKNRQPKKFDVFSQK